MPRGSNLYKGMAQIGGRRAGSPNKATIEKRLVAAQVIDRARAMNEPLAKEKLAELLVIAMGAMSSFQPVTEEMAKLARDQGNAKAVAKKGSWPMFGEWFDRSAYVAKALIGYQSPALKAIAIAPPPPTEVGGTKADVITLRVFEEGKVVKTLQKKPGV